MNTVDIKTHQNLKCSFLVFLKRSNFMEGTRQTHQNPPKTRQLWSPRQNPPKPKDFSIYFFLSFFYFLFIFEIFLNIFSNLFFLNWRVWWVPSIFGGFLAGFGGFGGFPRWFLMFHVFLVIFWLIFKKKL